MMINVEELRIGNVVDFKGGHYRVLEIRLMHNLSPSGYWVTLEGYNNPVHVIELNGIEVNDHLLKEYGFERQGDPCYVEWDYSPDINDKAWLCGESEGLFVVTHCGSWTSRDLVKVDSLHQLQNIVLHLTGKEL